MSVLPVKVVFETKDIRRFAFDTAPSPLPTGAVAGGSGGGVFRRLLALLRETFALSADTELLIRYEDEEGDMVLVTSDNCVAEAARQCAARSAAGAGGSVVSLAAPNPAGAVSTLKLFVTRKGVDRSFGAAAAAAAPAVAKHTAAHMGLSTGTNVAAAAAKGAFAADPTHGGAATPSFVSPASTPLVLSRSPTADIKTGAATAAPPVPPMPGGALLPPGVSAAEYAKKTRIQQVEDDDDAASAAGAGAGAGATPAPAAVATTAAVPAPVSAAGASATDALTPSPVPDASSGAAVHSGTTCALCGQTPIVGVRLRCTACAHFDMCEACDDSGVHDAAHVLVRARVPLECSPLCAHPCPPDCPITAAHRAYRDRMRAAAATTATASTPPAASPAATVVAAPAPAPAPVAAAAARSAELQSEFVADVTIPDGLVVAPGVALDKTWAIRNCGTGAWPVGVALCHRDGPLAPAAPARALTEPVVAGATVNLSVPLLTPKAPGAYRGVYQLRDTTGADGVWFGGQMWVEIEVRAAPLPAPAVAASAVPTAAPAAAASAAAAPAAAAPAAAAPAAAAPAAAAPAAAAPAAAAPAAAAPAAAAPAAAAANNTDTKSAPAAAAAPALDRAVTAPTPSVTPAAATGASASAAAAAGAAATAGAAGACGAAKPELKKPVSLAPYLSASSRAELEAKELRDALAKANAQYRGPFAEEVRRLRAMGFEHSDDALLGWIMLATERKAHRTNPNFDLVAWCAGKLLENPAPSNANANAQRN